MLSQYVTGALGPDTMYTIGVEFKIKEIQVEQLNIVSRMCISIQIQVDGKEVRLALWDTAGMSLNILFGSDRSPRSQDVCVCVRVCALCSRGFLKG